MRSIRFIRPLILFLAAVAAISCADQPTEVRPAADGRATAAIIPNSGTWTDSIASVSPRRVHGSGAWVNGKFHFIGGQDTGPEGNTFDLHVRFDPATGVWDTLAPAPYPNAYTNTWLRGDYLYLITNFGNSQVSRYSITNDSWESRATGPVHAWAAGAAVGAKFYLMGGSGDQSVDEYDAVNDRWTRKAPMPNGLFWAHAVTLGGKIYVVGGNPTGAGSVSQTCIYDPATNTWTSAPPSPNAGAFPSVFTLDGLLYTVSGTGATSAFNPATATWTVFAQSPTFVPGTVGAYGLLGRNFYIFGGYSTTKVAVFRPQTIGNHPPVVAIGGPYSGVEGSTVNFDGSASSDPDLDGITYLWSFGDGNTSTSATAPHVFANNGTYAVTLTVSDGVDSRTASRNVVIRNAIPVVTSAVRDTVLRFETWGTTASFVDPGADSWSATVDWGEGTGTEAAVVNGDNTVTLSHLYADAGSFLVTLRVDDGTSGGLARSRVIVLTTTTAINQLITRVLAEVADTARANAMATKLRQARGLFGTDYSAAVTSLGFFTSQVDSALTAGLDPALGAQLKATANRIIASLQTEHAL